MNSDHIRIHRDMATLECFHCTEKYTMGLPAPFDIVIAIMGAFRALHIDCKRKPTNFSKVTYADYPQDDKSPF
jgi:hypothetical protein